MLNDKSTSFTAHRQRKERKQLGELAFEIKILFWTGPFNNLIIWTKIYQLVSIVMLSEKASKEWKKRNENLILFSTTF